MHRRETLFVRSRERNLFGDLHEGPTSDFEYYLRFQFAVKNFMAHMNRDYCRSKMHYDTNNRFPERDRFEFFVPKRGKSMLVTTRTTTSHLPISFRLKFENDPLYAKFHHELDDPLKSFEFMLESEYLIDEENERLTYIFRNAYNDASWQSQLLKLVSKNSSK